MELPHKRRPVSFSETIGYCIKSAVPGSHGVTLFGLVVIEVGDLQILSHTKGKMTMGNCEEGRIIFIGNRANNLSPVHQWVALHSCTYR